MIVQLQFYAKHDKTRFQNVGSCALNGTKNIFLFILDNAHDKPTTPIIGSEYQNII